MTTEFGHKCEHIFIQKKSYNVDWTLKCVIFNIFGIKKCLEL